MSRSKWLPAAGAAMAIVLAFGIGYWTGGGGATQIPIYTAAGYVGADKASFQIDDKWYGFESSVPWRDEAGAEHEGGWPQCLPRLQEVQNVRLAASVLWHGDNGIARVVWVDCQHTGT